MVDKDVVGTLVCNGRAVKIISVRNRSRRNITRTCTRNTNRTVAHKDGAQVECLGSLPRVCCTNVVLITAHQAFNCYGGKNLSAVVEIGINEHTFGDGIANKLDGLARVGSDCNGTFGLYAHKRNLARERMIPTAVKLGAALVNDTANVVTVLFCHNANVRIDIGFDHITAIDLNPQMQPWLRV